MSSEHKPQQAPEVWVCSECGSQDISFDRSLCACGAIEPEEVIEQHKAGTINERQAIVSLARQVIELRDLLRDVMEANHLWSGR